MKVIFNICWLKVKTTKYVEFGIDPDNNKLIIGVSSEIENADGTEIRKKGFVRMKVREIYLRIWILKIVFCIGSSGISLKIKDRYNFKLLLGVGGI